MTDTLAALFTQADDSIHHAKTYLNLRDKNAAKAYTSKLRALAKAIDEEMRK